MKIFPFLVVFVCMIAVPALAQEEIASESVVETPASGASAAIPADDMAQRITLAEKMHDIWPVRTKVEDALDIAAQSFPEDQRDKFKAGMRKAIKYDQLEEESIAAMAKLFTVAELQKMVDFYGSPEGKSVSAKTDDYMTALEPVMTKMLDQALIEVRTGQ
jgi:hypothetical protein